MTEQPLGLKPQDSIVRNTVSEAKKSGFRMHQLRKEGRITYASKEKGERVEKTISHKDLKAMHVDLEVEALIEKRSQSILKEPTVSEGKVSTADTELLKDQAEGVIQEIQALRGIIEDTNKAALLKTDQEATTLEELKSRFRAQAEVNVEKKIAASERGILAKMVRDRYALELKNLQSMAGDRISQFSGTPKEIIRQILDSHSLSSQKEAQLRTRLAKSIDGFEGNTYVDRFNQTLKNEWGVKIDKEPLFNAAAESIEHFFKEASIYRQRIVDGYGAVRDSKGNLEYAQNEGESADNAVRNTATNVDYKVEEVNSALSYAQQKMRDQLRDVERRFSRDPQFLDFLQKQQIEWMNTGGLEQFVAELREADVEPNEVLRERKLEFLRHKVVDMVEVVDKEGKDLFADSIGFMEDSKNRKYGLRGRIHVAVDGMQGLRDRYPQTHFRIMQNLENMHMASDGHFNTVDEAMDNVPINSKMLSDTAYKLAVDISQIMAMIKKGNLLEGAESTSVAKAA